MKHRFLRCLLAPALLFFHLAAPAEDIDLFVGLTKDDVANVPNVLFVLDNAANFSASAPGCTYPDGTTPSMNGTTGGIEQCALYAAIQNLEVGDNDQPKMKIGLMAYNANKFVDWEGYKCDTVDTLGGCLMVPLTPMTAANKIKIMNWIKTWEVKDGFAIKTNNQATGAVMQEAWAYYAGRRGLSGRSYAAIKPASTCMKNYVVFIGNAYNASGKPGDQTGDKGPKDALENANSVSDKNAFPLATLDQKKIYLGPVTTQCGTFTFPTNHEGGGYYADEWARYMANPNATNTKTYTIGVHSSACQAEYASLLSSMATLGGGKYFPTMNFAELKIAFESILSEVQPVNTAFASVSLPVSVNTQGTYLNQVFIGMFRPDGDALPRWTGNLKQYKMGLVNGQLELLDADGAIAVDKNEDGTGFFAPCARSFWTPEGDDGYWTNITSANCIGRPGVSNTPDGNIVEKGAQGYMLRGMTPALRVVKTCSSAACTGLIDFNTTNATTIGMLGAVDTTERDAIINWARGLNNKAGDETFVATTAMRPSVHGDVVHSRPVAINFGTDAAPQVVVFYGGNDGALRAINGNRPDKATPNIGSVTPGSELWSFIAPETYPILKRLRDNSPKISFPLSTGGEPKSYGIDGPVVAYRDDAQTLVFATMRRGGNALYAFNVTNPATPALKWRFTDGGAIGQTWSPPRILKAAGFETGAKPMLIMGGGYDTCEDKDPHQCNGSKKGNKIYVLDAVTGAEKISFETHRSVVAEVFVVKDAATGLAKFAYAVDLGGNVYRISGEDANTPFGETPPANWKMTPIASLGCDDATKFGACQPNRKFMFAPDIVRDGGDYILLLGSGDREKPLTTWTSSTEVENHFFMLRDRPEDATWLTSENETCKADVICKDSLLRISSTTPTLAEVATKPKGWYLDLRYSEQVVTSAITVYGVTTFSTHIPATPATASSCSANLGQTSVYNISYINAGSANGTAERYEDVAGDGLPPSPVAGVVVLDDGTSVPFVIGSGPIPFTPNEPESPLPVKLPKSRVYWYIQQ